MTDMMSHDHAILEIVQERFQGLRFLHSPAAFLASDAVHRDGTGVVGRAVYPAFVVGL